MDPWLRPSLSSGTTQQPRTQLATRSKQWPSASSASASACEPLCSQPEDQLCRAHGCSRGQMECMPCHHAHPTLGPTTARIGHAFCAVRLRQEDAIVSWQRDQLCPPSSHTTPTQAHCRAGLLSCREHRPINATCPRRRRHVAAVDVGDFIRGMGLRSSLVSTARGLWTDWLLTAGCGLLCLLLEALCHPTGHLGPLPSNRVAAGTVLFPNEDGPGLRACTPCPPNALRLQRFCGPNAQSDADLTDHSSKLHEPFGAVGVLLPVFPTSAFGATAQQTSPSSERPSNAISYSLSVVHGPWTNLI